MKWPMAAVLPELQLATRKARETAAADTFDLAAVRLALHEAAKKGQSTLRMPVAVPGLHKTDAAKKLVEWCKCEGISATWEKRLHDVPGEGRQIEIMEPEFSW